MLPFSSVYRNFFSPKRNSIQENISNMVDIFLYEILKINQTILKLFFFIGKIIRTIISFFTFS